jgi:hypothetical protein
MDQGFDSIGSPKLSPKPGPESPLNGGGYHSALLRAPRRRVSPTEGGSVQTDVGLVW